jgi:hypothetical protein
VEEMKKLPIGIADFRYMIEEDYLYIDKTKYLHMLKDRGKFYFMSRPRRFGKSLTISTYDCMFRGEKELFKGTWLYDNWDFEPRPVIRLNMSTVETGNEALFKTALFELMDELYATHGFKRDSQLLKTTFRRLIERLYQKYDKRVIVLIDEYDKPILDHLEDHEMAEKIRTVLRTFYSTLKSSDEFLDFVFITGITKFTKIGVFSTLNNLNDISTWDEVSQMLGYTQMELEEDFEGYLTVCEQKLGFSREELFEEIKHHYNGFSFDGRHFVYNPFSILNFLGKYEFDNYWVESGSPSFIVKYAKRHAVRPDKFLGKYIRKTVLSAYEIEEAPPVSFLIQAGYLTFKAYKKDDGYLIDYPNREVRDSFSELLMVSEYNNNMEEANDIREKIRKALDDREFEALYEQMRRTFSNIPYTIFEPGRKEGIKESERAYEERLEGFYHAVILTMLWAAGINVKAEELTALGRSDLILEYEDDVYIIELKKQPPEVSLRQIAEKDYAGKYGGNLFYVGIEIEDEKRNLGDWLLVEK